MAGGNGYSAAMSWWEYGIVGSIISYVPGPVGLLGNLMEAVSIYRVKEALED